MFLLLLVFFIFSVHSKETCLDTYDKIKDAEILTRFPESKGNILLLRFDECIKRKIDQTETENCYEKVSTPLHYCENLQYQENREFSIMMNSVEALMRAEFQSVLEPF